MKIQDRGTLKLVVVFPPSVNADVGDSMNFVRLCEPLSQEMYVLVSGEGFPQVNEHVHLLLTRGYGEKEPLVIKMFKFVFEQLSASCNLIRISRNIDVVIFYLGNGAYLLPLLCAKLLGKKTVFMATGLYSQISRVEYRRLLFGLGGFIFSAIYKVLEKITFALVDRITVESPAIIESMDLSKYERKIAILGALYIDLSQFEVTKTVGEREALFGYIGRLLSLKGIRELVGAMPLILDERGDTGALIIGGGPLFEEIKTGLAEHGLSRRVNLLDQVPRDEIPHYLNKLKLFILPSCTEGLPGIVQEAMACGTPVLATAVGGIPDLIKDGETGFIMEDNSPQCIAMSVIRALNHPGLEEIARNARRLIGEEYSYQAMVGKCQHALDEMIKAKE